LTPLIALKSNFLLEVRWEQ